MTPTILIADDNLTIQRTAAEALSDGGLEVVTVANGMAAIKKIPALMPLVVVADVDMPGKDGYEVCEFVKAQPGLGHIRVLLAVSDTDPYDEERGVRVRADGVIKKPFVREELTSLVAKSIEQAQLLQPEALCCEPAHSVGLASRMPETEPATEPMPEPFEESGHSNASGPANSHVTPEPALPGSGFPDGDPGRCPESGAVSCDPAAEAPKTPAEAMAADAAPCSNPAVVEGKVGVPVLTEFEEFECYQEDAYDSYVFNAAPLLRVSPPPVDASSALPSAPAASLRMPPAPDEPACALEAAGTNPGFALSLEPGQSMPGEMDGDWPQEIAEKPASEAMPEPAIIPRCAASGPIAPLEAPFPTLTPPASASDFVPAIPGSQIDPSLVASVINAVVRRIAPPMFSPEMVRSLECRLTDEILSELASGGQPEA